MDLWELNTVSLVNVALNIMFFRNKITPSNHQSVCFITGSVKVFCSPFPLPLFPSFLIHLSDWTNLMDWFHLTLRQNLLNPTLNTWVSTAYAASEIDTEDKLFLTSSAFFVFLSSLHCSLSVNLVSLELTYFCSGLLFAAVVRRRVWDYAVTVTLLHVMITSLGKRRNLRIELLRQSYTLPNVLWNCTFLFLFAVMLEFPTVWQWWLALGKNCFQQLLHSSFRAPIYAQHFCCSTGSGLFLMICNGQLIAYFTCQSDQSYDSFSIFWQTGKDALCVIHFRMWNEAERIRW